jgi:hypothetical protein
MAPLLSRQQAARIGFMTHFIWSITGETCRGNEYPWRFSGSIQLSNDHSPVGHATDGLTSCLDRVLAVLPEALSRAIAKRRIRIIRTRCCFRDLSFKGHVVSYGKK